MRWHRLNVILHRDVGYLAFALTIVYGVSGLAVNHRADWNPNYKETRETRTISPLTATDRDGLAAEARAALALTDAPRNVFRPDPETLRLFYPNTTYSIDVPTGKVVIEQHLPRPVLKEFNDQQLLERVTPPRFLGPSAARVRIAYFSLVHTEDIYGQMVVYLRLAGVTPPASAAP